MSTRRRSLLDTVAITVVAAATGWLATTAWTGFTESPGGFLRPLLVLALLVVVIGTGLRQVRMPSSVVLLAQVLIGGVIATSLVAGELVLSREGWLAFGDAVGDAITTAQRYQAPVPDNVPGIEPLLILGGWLCLVLIDLCVGGLRRVSLAGLPLLTIYSIPVSMLGGGVPWWSFALAALGFLLLLYLQHREQTSRWGRGIGVDGRETSSSRTIGSTAVRASAGSLGIAAVLLAVMVPQFVPTMSLDVLGFGRGDGQGGDITVVNPMADLRRDLLQSEDRPVLRITTDNPEPSYLRLAVLNRFTDNEWSTGNRVIPDEQRAFGQLPIAEDIDPSVPRERFPTDVSVMMGFQSRWLPTSYPLERISAEGDWRYDTSTFDFFGVDEDVTTAGLGYSFTEVKLDYDAETMSESPTWSGRISRDFIEVPDDLPPMVRALAQEVTRDYPTSYEKAVALQNWFREDGGFEYSTDRVEQGNGSDELVAFLTEGEGGRIGYCEQFAASMAVMARTLNIPARMAVGFLEPTNVGGKTWEYSSTDMHAWPELYFPDYGWVLFEPTPADRAIQVPTYTEQRIPDFEETDGPNPSQSADDPQSNLGPDRQLDPGALPETDTTGGRGGTNWQPVLLGLAGLLLVTALLLAPRLVRGARGRRRLNGALEPAWAEIRATALDLGLPWPEHRSPRETQSLLTPYLGSTDPQEARERPVRGPDAAPDAVEALDRLVLRLERERYARPQGSNASLPLDPAVVADASTVTASLRGGATSRAVRRATWWPASVLPWRHGRSDLRLPQQLVRHGGVVDHVG